MARPRNAKELFDVIKSDYFENIDVAKVATMSDSEQQVFMLEQADHLLGTGDEQDYLWIYWFWERNEDCQRTMKTRPYIVPFFLPDEREAMTEDEKMLCAFYITFTGFMFDVLNHQAFDTTPLGIDDATEDFYVDNESLLKWIRTTKYENIAVHVAYTLYQVAIDQMMECYYQPAQDYLAELYMEDAGRIIQRPVMNGVSARAYIETIITALKVIDGHISMGLKKGMAAEEIFLHDCICGHFVEEYNPGAVRFAMELYAYMRAEYKKHSWICRVRTANISKQPEPVRKQMNEFMDNVTDKVCQERGKLGNGWLKNGSLAMGYVVAFAEQMVHGNFD